MIGNREVGIALGISPETVGRAMRTTLSDNRMAAATRQRILVAARELGHHLFTRAYPRPGWMDEALCKGATDAGWYAPPNERKAAYAAIKVCEACTVQAECLQYALAQNEKFGIWGGKFPDQRLKIRQQMEGQS